MTDRYPTDLGRDYRMLIGGEWVEAADGATFSCLHPYLGRGDVDARSPLVREEI